MAVTSALMLGSCQSTVEQVAEPSADICRVQDTPFQTVVNLEGRQISGEVTAVAGYQGQTWASAVFVPNADTAVEHYACSASRTVVPCSFCAPRVETYRTTCDRDMSLDEVRGLARVPMSVANAPAEADRLAQQNCEAATDRFFAGRLGYDDAPRNLSCVKLASAVCGFAEATPVPLTAVTGYVVGAAN